jgi:uroporphyrinogen-III decarboxylase
MKSEPKIFEADTMTAEQRLRAAIQIQVPDRVPVAPLIYYFNANYNGMSYADLYDPGKYNRGLFRMFEELGPWDIHYHIHVFDPEMVSLFNPMKMLDAGRELPPDVPRQFVEGEFIYPEDYEWLSGLKGVASALTYEAFMMKLLPRIWDTIPEGAGGYVKVILMVVKTLFQKILEYRKWESRGVAVLCSIGAEAAFDTLSMNRGILEFARDLKKRPGEIRRTVDAFTESFVLFFKLVCLLSGIKRVIIALHRTSNDFISPTTFKELAFPALKDLVERLGESGIETFMHCDGNWSENLEILRELPAGRAIMQCDGATDVFRAKEVLGDRVCIMGDVKADLLVLGSPTEVDEYCHRLIEEVGKGGGFILGSGCEIPPNAKPENVKAMLDSVAKYGYYDR